MRHVPRPGSGIADKEYAIALDDDRDRDKADQQRLRDDGLGLKGEQQQDREQKPENGKRLDPAGKGRDRAFLSRCPGKQSPPGQCAGDQRNDDI